MCGALLKNFTNNLSSWIAIYIVCTLPLALLKLVFCCCAPVTTPLSTPLSTPFSRPLSIPLPMLDSETQLPMNERAQYTSVKRTDIDNFTPNFGTPKAQSYVPTDTSNSFNHKLPYAALRAFAPSLCEEDYCIFCLESYCDDEHVLILPCMHYFHMGCFEEMVEVKKRELQDPLYVAIQHRCPLCQLNLLRHYLFYNEHNLDYKQVPFLNK